MTALELFASFAAFNPSVPPVDVHVETQRHTEKSGQIETRFRNFSPTIGEMVISLGKDTFIRNFAIIEQDFDIVFPDRKVALT